MRMREQAEGVGASLVHERGAGLGSEGDDAGILGHDEGASYLAEVCDGPRCESVAHLIRALRCDREARRGRGVRSVNFVLSLKIGCQ